MKYENTSLEIIYANLVKDEHTGCQLSTTEVQLKHIPRYNSTKLWSRD